jgi:DNA-directed RNA polymerase subunit beta'
MPDPHRGFRHVKYGDIVEGVTMEEQLDEVTGSVVARWSSSPRPEARRASSSRIRDGRDHQAGGENEARYYLPVGANIIPPEGQKVEAGDVIAKIPRETTKTKDITGGLPRVAELFEARKPKDHAIISEIDGIVSFGKDTKGKRKVVITPRSGEPKRVPDRQGQAHPVHEGDRVRAGEALMDGPATRTTS